jgi:hypothetical protein
MADPGQFNADQLAFWNGPGGRTWVERQEHTDIHLRGAASPGASMAFVCGRPLTENPWMEVPMRAVAPHIPPRPKPDPQAPGMFAFADPQRVSEVLIAPA